MNKLKPEIRFKGFDEEFKEKQIRDIAPLQRGFDLPKIEMIPGPFPVVMSNGINCFHSKFKVKAPGVVTGRSGTIGNVHYVDTDYWPHNTSLWVTDFKGNNPLYIYFLYKKIDLNRFGTGSGVPTLNRNDVHDQKVLIPQPNEQTQIGNFFQKLDTLIAQHQKKYDKLVILKKAMLEKMFPKPGKTIPEIRFKGFSGDWEAWILSDVFNIIDGDRGANYPSESDFSNSGHTLFLDTGNVKKNGFDFSTKKFISKEKDSALRSGKLELYDFVLTSRGTLGNVAYFNDTEIIEHPSVRINSAMLILRPIAKDKINDVFISSVLRGNSIDNFMSKNHVGSAQPHITKRDFSKHYVNIPTKLDEQQKIGAYFQNLDKLISNHQTQLTKLKNIKKACLEKMFV